MYLQALEDTHRDREIQFSGTWPEVSPRALNQLGCDFMNRQPKLPNSARPLIPSAWPHSDTTTVRVGSLKSMHARMQREQPRGRGYLHTNLRIQRRLRIYVRTTISFLGWRNSQRWLLAAAEAVPTGRLQLATPATSSTSTYSISSCCFSPFAFSPVLHDLCPPFLFSHPLPVRARARLPPLHRRRR